MAFVIALIKRLRYKDKEVGRTMRGVQKTNKQGKHLLHVYVEVNGEGLLYQDYLDPEVYDLALDYALTEADKWLRKYRTVGTKEART